MNGIRVMALLACAAAAWVALPIVRAFRRRNGPQAPGPSAASNPESAGDAAEQAVRRWREREVSCPRCGPRPESEALYCSSCGQELVD